MNISKSLVDSFIRSTERAAYGASLFKGKNNKIAADQAAVDEMRKVFNLGIGMVLVVPADQANETIEIVARNGHEAWVIGDVMAGTGQVGWSNE